MFKFYPIFFFSFIFLVYSCRHENNIPSTIIDENEMVKIITDLEITQAYLKIKSSTLDSSYAKFSHKNNQFSSIFKAHSINEHIFNSSIKYYSVHPKKMETIYTKVIIALSEKQATFH